MSLRKLYVIISQLPINSRFKSAWSGDESGQRWSTDTYLLADVANLLQFGNQISWVGGGLKKKPPRMQPVSWPGHVEAYEDPELVEKVENYLDQYAPPTAEPTAEELERFVNGG